AFKHLEHRPGDRVVLEYEIPLGEIIHDFYDQLKSRSKGYASMDYEMIGFREGELVKLDVLVAGEPVDALSLITHRSKAQTQGRRLTEKLKAIIPRQLYEVPIQAASAGKIIARETCAAPGSATTSAKPMDVYAIAPSESDVRSLLGDSNWTETPPSFEVLPLDFATRNPLEQYSVSVRFIHLGTAEELFARYTLYDKS